MIGRVDLRKRLRVILKNKSLKVAKEGEKFVLSSGQESSYFVDGKKTTSDPEGLSLITCLLLVEIDDLKVDAIGGPALGAIPIIGGMVQLSYLTEKPIPGFMAREETKKHGTCARIEGESVKGKRVVIVDDVVTTGGSVFRAIRAVRDEGAEVVRVLAIIDREQGAEEAFREAGLEYRPLFKISELLSLRGGN